MTTDQRIEALARTVDRFIKGSSEFQIEVTKALKVHSQALEAHNKALEAHNDWLQDQGRSIKRLDAIIERWDRWLRGEGSGNGHKRRK